MRQFSFRFWKSTAVVFSLVACGVAVLAATALGAFANLDSRVDVDGPAGISGGQDAGELDAVGGTVTADAVAVPWTVFEKQTSGEQQIFSRAFAGGAWLTKGHGTVNGVSSASPTFLSSLNFDQNKDAEAPSIDFAGTGRNVPWATWYEDGHRPVRPRGDLRLALRPRARQVGLRRPGTPRHRRPPVLNIRTNKDAEDPEVAGGNAAGDTTKPGPVDHLAGDRPDDRPDLRRQADRPGHDRVPGRHQARGRRAGWRLLLAAGRGRALPGLEPVRAVAQRRPEAHRDRAGHHLHRRQRCGAVGGLVRGRSGPLRRHQRARVRGQGGLGGDRHRDGRRRLPLGGGRQRHRRAARCSTPPAPTARARVSRRRRRRTTARSTATSTPTPRTRRSPPAR